MAGPSVAQLFGTALQILHPVEKAWGEEQIELPRHQKHNLTKPNQNEQLSV